MKFLFSPKYAKFSGLISKPDLLKIGLEISINQIYYI
jgi:hypothetical protein